MTPRTLYIYMGVSSYFFKGHNGFINKFKNLLLKLLWHSDNNKTEKSFFKE